MLEICPREGKTLHLHGILNETIQSLVLQSYWVVNRVDRFNSGKEEYKSLTA